MSVFGVGIYESGEYTCRDFQGNLTKEYSTWKHMLERCYDKNYLKKFPTYVDCLVEDHFLNFQNYATWANSQKEFHVEGSCLDKDLLVKGNKIYSKDTCVFVPHAINALLNKHKARRGNLPLGVSINLHKYMATICLRGKNKNLGRYETPEEAFRIYKEAKERYIKEIADEYASVISEKVYNALIYYTVEESD